MRNQRSKRFIDPEVQGALVRRLVMHWCCFIGATVVLALLLAWLNNPLTSSPRQAVAQAWNDYGAILLLLTGLMPVFVFDAIKLSHRFAGPIHRLKQATSKLAKGESAEPVELRESDYWRTLADDVNRIIERLDHAESATSSKVSA